MERPDGGRLSPPTIAEGDEECCNVRRALQQTKEVLLWNPVLCQSFCNRKSYSSVPFNLNKKNLLCVCVFVCVCQ